MEKKPKRSVILKVQSICMSSGSKGGRENVHFKSNCIKVCYKSNLGRIRNVISPIGTAIIKNLLKLVIKSKYH